MLNKQQTLATILAGALISAIWLSTEPADARSFSARGSRGAMAGRANSFAGANGGTWSRAGGGAMTHTGGLFGRAFKGAGPNGGSAQGYRMGGYKQGVGAFGQSATQLQGAGGSTYNGWAKGQYNAQTGQGTYNSSRSGYNAQTGSNYGWTNDTSYTKGQGATTTLDTLNKGDYTIDWQKGQKPVVTPVTTGQ